MAKRDKTYIRPMLEVYQMLDDTVGVVGEHLTACVIGPQYDLYRYGLEKLTSYPYSAGGQDLEFVYEKDPAFDYSVDQDFANLYGEELEADMYSGNAENGKVKAYWESADHTTTREYGFSVTVDGPNYMTLRLGTDTFSDAEGTVHTVQGLFACRDHDKVIDTESCLLTGEKGYCVEEADVIHVTDTENVTRTAVIKEVLGTPIPASVSPGGTYTAVATDDPGIYVNVPNKTDNLVCGGTYDGEKNTTLVVRVTDVDADAGKISIRVSDTEGLGWVYNGEVTLPPSGDATPVSLALGLTLTFKSGVKANLSKVKKDDYYTFVCLAASARTDEFNGIELTNLPLNLAKVLSKESGYGVKDIRITKVFTDDIPERYYTVSATEITTQPNIALQISQTIAGRTSVYTKLFTSGLGRLYPCFRVLVIPGRDEDVYEIDELSDITRYFGAIDQDNLLAYGCYRAFMGAAKRMIYAVRTRGTTKEDFYDAVKKTESNRATYSFCPLTNEYEVAEVVADFNDEMSAPDVKRWRRTIVGVEGSGQYRIAWKARSKETHNLENIKATFSADLGGENVLLQVDDDLDFDFREIAVNDMLTKVKNGDLIRVSATGDYFKVKEVLSDKMLRLQSGPSTQISVSVQIEVFKAATPENNVEYLGLTANSFANRRVLLVWTDHGVLADNDLAVPVANMFLAAEIAGLSSAVLPQASITHTEITGITAASRMYTQYSQKQLDEIASYGVLVITQDAKDEPCYIRHQLTTDMAHGALYREDSCTRNLDNISYAMVDILEKYIGHANVTPSALAAIRDDVTARLNEFTKDGTDPMIGPSLVSWDNLRVQQDKVFKDRVNIWVDLYLPLPLNNIRLYEMAYAATVEI